MTGRGIAVSTDASGRYTQLDPYTGAQLALAEAYRKQLRRFREHYADAGSQLQQRAMQAGAPSAEAYCHALKGVVGNLSATALYDQVADIDARLQQGQPPDAAALAEMQVRLQAVIDDIDHLTLSPALQPAPAPAPLNPVEINQRLERLAHALDYDLGAAEPLILELRAGVSGTPLEPEIAAIATQVDRFAIDEALNQLNTLQERLKPAN